MDKNVKNIYMNIVGRNKTPDDIFTDWIRFKRVAQAYDVEIPQKYPTFVRWAKMLQPK